MKRTKIICTIGPATEARTKIKELIGAGMNAARLNFSHGTCEHHAMLIKNIRAAADEAGEPVAIIQDLQGPRIRLGKLPADGVSVKKGDVVSLVCSPVIPHASLRTGLERKDVKHPEAIESQDAIAPHSAGLQHDIIVLPTQVPLQKIVKKGEPILIKDGLVRLIVIAVDKKGVRARVEQGDILTSNRGINLPKSNLPDVVLTAKDREDVKFGLEQRIDWIALSFVRTAADIARLRKLLPRGEYHPKIIAKIERPEAVKNFDEILAAADAVMVARGDLGIELPAEDIPLIQKDLIAKCRQAGKPVIVATQMLESMTLNPRPTRAEVSDVANAVIDHTDSCMLSGETASGKYPLAACRMMRDIITETEASRYDDAPAMLARDTVPNLIAYTIKQVLEYGRIKAIVAVSSSGTSAQLISSERPEAPILALTQNEATHRQMSLVWGVSSYIMKRCRTVDDLIDAAVMLVKKELKAKIGDKIIIASGHPTGPHGHLNLLKIHTV